MKSGEMELFEADGIPIGWIFMNESEDGEVSYSVRPIKGYEDHNFLTLGAAKHYIMDCAVTKFRKALMECEHLLADINKESI